MLSRWRPPNLSCPNVNLAESDAMVTKVGTIVRSSGRLIRNGDQRMRTRGMLDKVQGMGVPLEAHGISQVSMNLQDVGITDMHHAFEVVKSLASDHGVSVDGSELVGLAPLSSFLAAGRWYSPGEVEESALIEAAVKGLGLDRLGPFEPKERIIEYAGGGSPMTSFKDSTLAEFALDLASDAPTPGVVLPLESHFLKQVLSR